MSKPISVFSLEEKLKKVGELSAEGRVESISLKQKMALVGFIPFAIPFNDMKDYDVTNSDYPLYWGINLNENLCVGTHRVRYSNSRFTYPIMKKISPAKGKVYDVVQNVLIMALPRNIPGSNNKNTINIFSNYFSSPNEYNSQKVLKTLRTYKISTQNLKSTADGKLQYEASDDEYEFSETFGGYKCVGNSFVCLCEYINPVTGNPSFALFNPDDLVKVE